eukprot:comp20129_c0_seq1/m.24856 comp20129_c0_seq1/g.24856  ORF comp20129_c0_seq1/g.24856 comp20129_c0_seq1/m.24856 type:complete len:326 (-) comp20129_c0_seq1:30-1007(-)
MGSNQGKVARKSTKGNTPSSENTVVSVERTGSMEFPATASSPSGVRRKSITEGPLGRTLGETVPKTTEVIKASNTETVREVLRRMQHRGVQSLPVCNSEFRWIGIVTCRLLLQYVAARTDDTDLDVPIKDAIKLDDWDIVSISDKETLQSALHQMIFNKAHRLQVVDEHNSVVGVVTQKMIISMISENLDALCKTPDVKLRDIHLISNAIDTCTEGNTVVEIMRRLAKAQYQALAVVDSEGKMVGEICVSSVREMEHLSDMDQPIGTSNFFARGMVTGTADMTFRQAIKLMADRKLYRLFLLEGGKPVGLLTLSDCLLQLTRASA